MIRNESLCNIQFTTTDIEHLPVMQELHKIFQGVQEKCSNQGVSLYGLLSYVDEEVDDGHGLYSEVLTDYLGGVCSEQPFIESILGTVEVFQRSGLFDTVAAFVEEHPEVPYDIRAVEYPDVDKASAECVFVFNCPDLGKCDIDAVARSFKEWCRSRRKVEYSTEGNEVTFRVGVAQTFELEDENFEDILHDAFLSWDLVLVRASLVQTRTTAVAVTSRKPKNNATLKRMDLDDCTPSEARMVGESTSSDAPSASGVQLWMEGYSASGNSSTARYCGFYEVSSLREAVEAWAKESSDRASHIDMENLTFWGCRFFDNEKDARVSFG